MKIGKDRAAVWSENYPGDISMRFKIRPLTPILGETITNAHLSASLVNEGGQNRLQTNIKSFGITREQAKAVVTDWEGVLGDSTMGPLEDKPLPCTDKYKAYLFDLWDDGGLIAAFVMTQANKLAEIREGEVKNSEAQPATS